MKPRGNPSAGGKTLTPARLAALAKARAARTLTPNNPGVSKRALATLLGALSTLLATKAEPGVVSLKVLARACGRNEKSIRRYLCGEKVPPSTVVQAMQVFLRKHELRGIADCK